VTIWLRALNSKGWHSVNFLKRAFNAWRESRFRQYELRLAEADDELRSAAIQFRVLERAIDGLNAMIAELTKENAELTERCCDLTELAERQANHIAQLELALSDPEHIRSFASELP